jgi:vacuolar-type H+-ATPase subunit I/STV1
MDRQTADIFTKPLGLDKLRQFLGALGLRHLDVPYLRGRDEQEGRKARKEQEEEARDAESTERRKEAEPEAAEPN